jgi:uncharacterized protein
VATYLSPGVYIEEVDTGPKPIAGLPTNVAAIVGMTEKGPALRPVRLSSWNDFISRFGGYVEGYTPEAVFGFFENGGTACYVVRADDATTRMWDVRDGNNDIAFRVQAESPGEWGSKLQLAVSRETGGGEGVLFHTTLRANANLNADGAATLQVASVAGVAPGMVIAIKGTTGDRVLLDVTAVGDDTIDVVSRATGNFPAASSRVYARQTPASEELILSAGSGFQAGDLIVADQPNRTRRYAAVNTARNTGVGSALTLAQGFGGEVAGMQFAERRVHYRARTNAAAASIPVSALTWLEELPPTVTTGDRIHGAGGLEADWGATAFQFGSQVPAGDFTVESTLEVHLLEVATSLDNPTLAQLASQFGYVPTGAVLVLSTAGGDEVEITRTAGGFSVDDEDDLGTGGAPRTFTNATFQLDVAALTGGILVRAARAPRVGDFIEFAATNRVLISAVEELTQVGTDAYRLTFAANGGTAPAANATRFQVWAWQPTTFRPLRFGLQVARVEGGAVTEAESFTGLSMSPTHSRYYLADGVVNQVSRLITVGERVATTTLTTLGALPATVDEGTGGAAGSIKASRLKEAFRILEGELEPALLACPDTLQLGEDVERADVFNSMVTHAEKMRRFAVIDLPRIADDQELLAWRQRYLDSTYAAAYAPFLQIVNPRAKAVKKVIEVPPSGYVMGVFARTDTERGVFKAPANERIRGVVGLATNYTQGRQDLLNPNAVNLVRAFPGRGIRIWGARNLTTDTQWRYVNVRRLFLMIENSIDQGTQWVVFEPNDSPTWVRVRVSVENFLNQIWRAGGLQGGAPEEAYRVRVGLGLTMTQTDIDLGLMIIEVAVAPVKPAEFVVFRISHKVPTE